jgi:hypothetical protein
MLFSCTLSGDDEPKEKTTRMTIDLNPSVQFMLDEENRVVSVTALNDDGAILIAGEAFIGLSAEEASELFLELARQIGYLVDSEALENEIKVSISGASEYASKLRENVKSSIQEKLDELDIGATIKQIEEIGESELRALLAKSSSYEESELEEMSKEELYNALSLARTETALLITEDLRNAYLEAKEYEISFIEREETAKVIDQISTLHAAMNTAYKASLNAYKAALDEIEEQRYNNLIAPESSYQQALNALRDKKALVIEKKNELAALEIDTEEYEAKLNELNAIEAQYNGALEALLEIGKTVNDIIDALLAKLRELEEVLVEFENSFSDDIKAELEAKAGEIELAVNEAKGSFFEAFENEHKSDIESMEKSLIQRKQALIEANAKAE